MYIPSRYAENDPEKIFAFVEAHPFGMLISQNEDDFDLTHIPMRLIQENSGQWRLFGHIAKANPQSAAIAEGRKAKAVFTGPHTYISSSWYEKLNVPTWNYIAVHLNGVLEEVVDVEEKVQEVMSLTQVHEKNLEHQKRIAAMPEKQLIPQIHAITVFSMQVEKVEAKYKMSQNRNARDYQNIINHLEQSNFIPDQAVATEMRKLKEEDDG